MLKQFVSRFILTTEAKAFLQTMSTAGYAQNTHLLSIKISFSPTNVNDLQYYTISDRIKFEFVVASNWTECLTFLFVCVEGQRTLI